MHLPAAIHAILSALLLTASVACADTVRLRNGNTIEGLVAQETDTQVVLDMGTGRTTLSRSSIATVVRASDEDNNRLRAEWKQKYFLHRQYTPAELTGISAEFAKLVAQHAGALNAHRTLNALPAREKRLQEEQEQLRTQIIQMNKRIQQTPPARNNVEAYNALVSENNALQARGTTSNDELMACRKDRDAAIECIAAYQDAVSNFNVQFAEEQKKTANEKATAERTQFLDRLAQTMAEYTREFAAAEVPVTQAHNSSIVTVTVNDQAHGRFIVDTGATQVTVSEAFARKLKIDLEKLPEAECTLADGRKVKGHNVMFRTVMVGDARAENIEAVIFPNGPGPQLDGLLGMSFLKNFSVNLDGTNGKLVLREFKPKP